MYTALTMRSDVGHSVVRFVADVPLAVVFGMEVERWEANLWIRGKQKSRRLPLPRVTPAENEFCESTRKRLSDNQGFTALNF